MYIHVYVWGDHMPIDLEFHGQDRTPRMTSEDDLSSEEYIHMVCDPFIPWRCAAETAPCPRRHSKAYPRRCIAIWRWIRRGDCRVRYRQHGRRTTPLLMAQFRPVRVCVCVRERGREYVFVYVCVRERERASERERERACEKKRKKETQIQTKYTRMLCIFKQIKQCVQIGHARANPYKYTHTHTHTGLEHISRVLSVYMY